MKQSSHLEYLTLEERLSLLPDCRRAEGKRHAIHHVLLIVIMAVMSGITGLRAFGDFVERNKKELKQYLKPKKNRLPSYPTITRVLKNLPFKEFAEQFSLWASSCLKIDTGEWMAFDGKTINGTMKNYSDATQQVTQLVSAFLIQQKQVVGAQKIKAKTSEILAVKKLIEALGLQGKIFRMDALHCQKKRRNSSRKVETNT